MEKKIRRIEGLDRSSNRSEAMILRIQYQKTQLASEELPKKNPLLIQHTSAGFIPADKLANKDMVFLLFFKPSI